MKKVKLESGESAAPPKPRTCMHGLLVDELCQECDEGVYGDEDDTCYECGDEGYIVADCGEDTCCCLDPEESHGLIVCPNCRGGK